MRCVVSRSSSIQQRCINIISIFPFSDVTCLHCLTMNLFFKIYLLIYFGLCWVFTAVLRLSLVVASGGYSSLRYVDFSLQWLLWLQNTGCRCVEFSSCSQGLSNRDSRALQHWLSSCGARGLVTPQYVGTSQTRDQTGDPCTNRQILNHQTIREACLVMNFYIFK